MVGPLDRYSAASLRSMAKMKERQEKREKKNEAARNRAKAKSAAKAAKELKDYEKFIYRELIPFLHPEAIATFDASGSGTLRLSRQGVGVVYINASGGDETTYLDINFARPADERS